MPGDRRPAPGAGAGAGAGVWFGRMATACAALLMAGCAVPSASEPDSEPTGERRVDFRCANGETVQLRFFPQQGVAVLVRGGSMVELQQQPAASGFVYANGPTTVRGKGDDLILEIGRMVPIRCRAG